MSEALVLGILAVIGGVAGAAATIVTALRKVEDSNIATLTERVAKLEAHSTAQDRQISALDDWKLAARHYISTLRGVLADRGISSPEPPPELELHREE